MIIMKKDHHHPCIIIKNVFVSVEKVVKIGIEVDTLNGKMKWFFNGGSLEEMTSNLLDIDLK